MLVGLSKLLELKVRQVGAGAAELGPLAATACVRDASNNTPSNPTPTTSTLKARTLTTSPPSAPIVGRTRATGRTWEGRYLGINRVGAGARTRDEATIDEAAMVAACLAAVDPQNARANVITARSKGENSPEPSSPLPTLRGCSALSFRRTLLGLSGGCSRRSPAARQRTSRPRPRREAMSLPKCSLSAG